MQNKKYISKTDSALHSKYKSIFDSCCEPFLDLSLKMLPLRHLKSICAFKFLIEEFCMDFIFFLQLLLELLLEKCFELNSLRHELLQNIVISRNIEFNADLDKLIADTY